MLPSSSLRNAPKYLTACALLLVACALAKAQNPGGSPGSIVFYGAGNSQPNNQIYTMKPDGTSPERVTFDTASDVDPDISPNGKSIVFTSNQTGNNDIYITDRQSGTSFDLTNNPANDEWARFSPDGKQIVFDSNRDGGVFEIFVMNADGSGTPTQLTFPPTLGRYPSWSPDGKQIIFRHGIDLYVMNADGSGTPTQLTNEVGPSFAQMPNFSPNGQYVTFMSFREGYCSVFLMNSDGSGQTNLTPKAPADPSTSWCSRAPAWSADGREIYFMSFRPSTGGHNQLFVMNTDGSNLQQLTSAGTNGEPRSR